MGRFPPHGNISLSPRDLLWLRPKTWDVHSQLQNVCPKLRNVHSVPSDGAGEGDEEIREGRGAISIGRWDDAGGVGALRLGCGHNTGCHKLW